VVDDLSLYAATHIGLGYVNAYPQIHREWPLLIQGMARDRKIVWESNSLSRTFNMKCITVISCVSPK
jgi:hypothetical protein